MGKKLKKISTSIKLDSKLHSEKKEKIRLRKKWVKIEENFDFD